MCGIAGYVDLRRAGRVDPAVVAAMSARLVHRGPDSDGAHAEPDAGLAARRLKILDLATGDQPIANEDGSVVVVCNGEIFNYRELRAELAGRGHRFRTQGDVEVLVHLYEERGEDLVDVLNGQFAFALWDRRRRRLLLGRDHFGISPLYFARHDGLLLFGSEIKAILAHPDVPRALDPVAVDQVLSLPGVVSPRTLFRGIESLPAGHLLVAACGEGGAEGDVRVRQYWDLDYPRSNGATAPPAPAEEREWIEALREVFGRSVRRRLHADVPVGLFVSGGLDSALVAAFTAEATPGAPRHTFSVAFDDAEIDESRFQRLVTRALGSEHHEIRMDDEAILARLRDMVLHCECPVKESFNTCAMALAESARRAGIKVVLAGQGADELFGGYPGYRFDAADPSRRRPDPFDVDAVLEEELRERLWGDRDLFYERDQVAFRDTKRALYSPAVRARFDEVDCCNRPLVDPERVRGRHPVHQRSYLDVKLRLADHLLTDHGDRMVMAHSVEGRYPFLDVELVDLVRRMPPQLKVKDLTEKYAVRKLAEGVVPPQVLQREKFGFRAPGTPWLLQRRVEWAEDLLSPALVRRLGLFDPDVVDHLRRRYAEPGYRLHPHLETDLLMVVLTVNLLCEQFDLPALD